MNTSQNEGEHKKGRLSRWRLTGFFGLLLIGLILQQGEARGDEDGETFRVEIDPPPPITSQEYLAALFPPPHARQRIGTDAFVRQRIGVFLQEHAMTLGAVFGLFSLGVALLRWRTQIHEAAHIRLPTKKTILWVGIAGVGVVLAYGALQMWRLARCTELITSQVFLKARHLRPYQEQYQRVCGKEWGR